MTLLSLLVIYSQAIFGQQMEAIGFQTIHGLVVGSFIDRQETIPSPLPYPLFSLLVNDTLLTTQDAEEVKEDREEIRFRLGPLQVTLRQTDAYRPGCRYELQLQNTTTEDTLTVKNLVPLGESTDHVYITGQGDHWLSRTHLFRPGRAPVNVIVPDNAWELGYAAIETDQTRRVAALARRISWEKAQRRRFETHLYPGGSVTYHLWFDFYEGAWQEGLRRIFQERYLYDLEGKAFDESLYHREDLDWIRHSYAMHLIMAWDRDFYDAATQTYRIDEFLERARKLYGGDEVIGLWPNWPMLGLDQRNQWDLFRDLPGGTAKLQQLAEAARARETRFFLSYNPWDESTRWEDHHAGMSDMIATVTADGVVLDTEGKSSFEHQEAADRVRPGVVMYSEGMAVPKDMPTIVAGRVHNALYYPPLLNLNKFIRPDFAIFRVAEIHMERIRREYALSFFNGYGTEINQFRPGRPDWVEEDYRFWGRLLMIQRQNSRNFTAQDFTPLISTRKDLVYVNEWPGEEKTVYTIFSLLPEGYTGPLFQTEIREEYHLVDLWNHTLIEPDTMDGQWQIAVDLEGFSAKWLGTNNEGAVGAIAVLPELLRVERRSDALTFSAPRGDRIRIWPAAPSYEQQELAKDFSIEEQTIYLTEQFGPAEGKFVVQLFEEDQLLDETIFEIPPGLARLVSKEERTEPARETPAGMVRIPAGPFRMKVTFGDNFIPNPVEHPRERLQMSAFYMDKHPVTNAQFKSFLDESGYAPADAANFLKHWLNGEIPAGQEQYPVVYVSYEDARAYARWAGKRLPTEIEWQYAAQTSDGREWPWSKEADIRREQQVITNTLTVSKLQVDSTLCNAGNGRLYPVGAYPEGANPHGLEDLVGCVWQLTNDLYDNGTNYFLILKGGSYFLPASSWWYVEGGPRELTYSQKLLRVSPGFERNGTVGFRCVRD